MAKRNIYRQAIDVQNASNPSGVIHTLAEEILPGVQAEPGYREQGTSYLRTNPALVLFMFKLADMFGIAYLSGDSINRYGDMEDECLKRAETAEALEAIVEAVCD
jgi:hypothetical protein